MWTILKSKYVPENEYTDRSANQSGQGWLALQELKELGIKCNIGPEESLFPKSYM